MPKKPDKYDFFLDRNEMGGAAQPLTGIWRGFVEFNVDPEQLGRVKVRVPYIHGASRDSITTEDLPWAFIAFTSGGGYDFGSFDVPLVGSAVFVMFEQGSPDYPVIVGYPYAKPDYSVKYNKCGGLPESEISMGEWQAASGNEVPVEAQDTTENDPQKRVIFKTPKGSTLYIEDKDGAEFIRVIDRVGQAIEMYCPVTAEKNKGNAAQRGDRMTVDNTPTEDSHTGEASMKTQFAVNEYCENEQSWIKLKDARGQYLKLWAKYDEEKVILYSKSGHFIILDSSSGEELIRIEDKSGNFIEIDSVENDETEYVQHDKNQEIGNDKTEQIGNDKTETIGGNKTVNISGNWEVSVSGTITITGSSTIDVSASADVTIQGANIYLN